MGFDPKMVQSDLDDLKGTPILGNLQWSRIDPKRKAWRFEMICSYSSFWGSPDSSERISEGLKKKMSPWQGGPVDPYPSQFTVGSVRWHHHALDKI